MMRGITICVLLSLAGMAAPVSAAILATYPMSSATTTDSTFLAPASANSQDTDLNSTASVLTGGNGYAGINGAGNNFTGISTQGSGSIFVRVAATGADLPASMSANQYFTFTLTPTTGFAMNLSSLTFQTAFTHTATSGTPFTGNIAVRSSVDNFLTDLFSLTGQASSSTITFANRSITSIGSAPAFQGVTVPVEFRFYFFDNIDTTSDAAAVNRLDTVVLNGDVVAIPEPSSVLLGVLGTLGLLVLRKRAL